MARKIGILTGGGDCPGLNAVIRGAVWKGIKKYGFEMYGIENGWKGLVEGRSRKLELEDVRDIISKGGTIIGTSRTNPAKSEDILKKAMENYRKMDLSALIVIGGDDTNTGGYHLSKAGANVVGVPKTIDNDLSGTDVTFGFDTAINIATDAIDRIRSTAESHERVFVVELMGRHAGWITLEAGIASGADIILLPEKPFSLDNLMLRLKRLRHEGRKYAIIAVSEGARLEISKDTGSLVFQDLDKDEYGHVRLGGIAKKLSDEIEDEIGWESRHVVLGHLQRGGNPTAFDIFLSTRFGIAAIDEVAKENYGVVVCLRGTEIEPMTLDDKLLAQKLVRDKYIELSELFQPDL